MNLTPTSILTGCSTPKLYSVTSNVAFPIRRSRGTPSLRHRHHAFQTPSATEDAAPAGTSGTDIGETQSPAPSRHGQRLAVLQAQKSAVTFVDELHRPLASYMTLPASQYSVLDARRIERLDEDTFRCYVGGLHFLNFHVEPVLTLSVVVGERGPTVRLLSTELQGSKVVVDANKRFTATMVNSVRWQESHGGGKEIASETSIEVTLQVPTWFVLPVGVIERSGCAVMQRVLNTAVPRFLEQLKSDYAAWAAGDESRKPVADGELL